MFGRALRTFLAAALTAVLAAGCGSDDAVTPSATTESTAELVDIGQTITYSSIGATTGLDCANGKSLNVIGSNNTLTVGGTCERVIVGGPDNRITVQKIAREIVVVGFHNTITYHDGDPVISDTGDANTIIKS